MTLPANVRINLSAPFPSLVTSSGPVTVAKSNGIWTIGFSVMALGQQTPPTINYATDFLYVYDSVAQTAFRASLSQLGLAGGGNQRYVNAAPVAILPTDLYVHLNLGASSTITLPSFTARSGVPLIIKDVGMQATAFPQTIQPVGGETIDGFGSVSLNTNGQAIRLVPSTDGSTNGWILE
jgi:hypothetical protein